MREIESAIQNLIYDGMDIHTGSDPFRFFVYTSFQELATNRSHRRVGELARAAGAPLLHKLSGRIAGDEGVHARAYKTFVREFLEIDPEGQMLAMADMLKKQIIMPAMNLRERGDGAGESFRRFEILAQRLGVYTTLDYVEIMESLLADWNVARLTGLRGDAARAQDTVCGLPARYRRLAARAKRQHTDEPIRFRWNL
jgi:acyl-[acyl-carrier-protein] desaturase